MQARLTHLRSAIKHKSNVLLYILHLQILHYVTLLISSSYKIHHCHTIRVDCTVQNNFCSNIFKDFLPYYRLYNKYSFVYGICSKGLQRKLEYTKKRFTWKSSTRELKIGVCTCSQHCTQCTICAFFNNQLLFLCIGPLNFLRC